MKRDFTRFGLAIALFLGSLIALFALYATITNESAHLTTLLAQSSATASAVTRTTSLRNALSKVSAEATAVNSYFVSSDGVVAFIDSMEASGVGGADVTVNAVSTGGTASSPTLLITLSVAGQFDAVMRTAGVLENAPSDVTVTSLSLSKTDSASKQAAGSGAWLANMNLIVGALPAAATSTASS